MEGENGSTLLTTGKEIRWKASEYVYREKSIDWYWYFCLVALILIGSSLYLHNTLFAFILAIGAFTMLIYSNKRPRELEYRADSKGIAFDDVFYSYQDILFFHTIDDKKLSEEKLLLLRLKKTTSTIVIIPVGNGSLDEVRTFLLNFIEDKEIGIPFGQIFMNLIGF
ncbi:MAG: hypothetical protein M0P76_06350 [Candidatus Pacebacteria bacterium]|jgi:hypothetical protein|nr:hypothetical protein [Candidatus Paceibacterota bacterium]